jgi:hypothetical protein
VIATGASVVTRSAVADDAPAIAEIYNQGIRERIATFETRERTAEEILPWLADPPHPLLVAVAAGVVTGWVRASTYRQRECYASIGEFSVYVDHAARGRGVGDASTLALSGHRGCRRGGRRPSAGEPRLASALRPPRLSRGRRLRETRAPGRRVARRRHRRAAALGVTLARLVGTLKPTPPISLAFLAPQRHSPWTWNPAQ